MKTGDSFLTTVYIIYTKLFFIWVWVTVVKMLVVYPLSIAIATPILLFSKTKRYKHFNNLFLTWNAIFVQKYNAL